MRFAWAASPRDHAKLSFGTFVAASAGMLRSFVAASIAFGSVAFASGCTASGERPVVAASMANDGSRFETMEATARVLDDHPKYVDDFYAIAKRHPIMMDRFLANATTDMADPAFAKRVATFLATNPEAVKQIIIAATESVKDDPKDRAAFDAAIASRHGLVADILTDSPHAVTVISESQADAVMKKDAARRALLEAMTSRADEFAEIMVHDPRTMHIMMVAIAKKIGHDRGGFKAMLESLEPNPPASPSSPPAPGTPPSPATPPTASTPPSAATADDGLAPVHGK